MQVPSISRVLAHMLSSPELNLSKRIKGRHWKFPKKLGKTPSVILVSGRAGKIYFRKRFGWLNIIWNCGFILYVQWFYS